MLDNVNVLNLFIKLTNIIKNIVLAIIKITVILIVLIANCIKTAAEHLADNMS